MLKISFWLKKPNDKQGNLVCLTIGNPEKILAGKLTNNYACEVSLPNMEKSRPIYGINPINTLCIASEFSKIYLQGLIKNSYTISEAESREPWKLEKLSDNFLQGKIDEIKKNKNYKSSNLNCNN